MVLDYKDSNASPYQELLFIPGKFRITGQKRQHISRIFVSTEESVINGRKNWAIPKEQADFYFKQLQEGIEKVLVEQNKERVFQGKFSLGGLTFPVNTYIFPYRLVQIQENRAFHTCFTGNGWGKLVHVHEIRGNPAQFPVIAEPPPRSHCGTTL